MENKFNIVYQRLIALKLDENILCRPFWLKIKRLREDFNQEKCWDLLKENIEWLINSKKHFNLESGILTTSELKEWFTKEELENQNIYIEGKIKVSDCKVIGLGSADIEATGHSKVVLFDSASAICYDSSFVSGFQNSSFTVNDCIGDAFDNCVAIARGLSIVENFTENTVDYSINCLVVNR